MDLNRTCNATKLNTNYHLNYSCSWLSSNLTSMTPGLHQASATPKTKISYEFSPINGTARYFCYVLYVLVLVLGTFGNAIVFYVIGYRKKKRNGGDVYILSLACADFLSSVFIPMIMLNDLLTNMTGWVYGEVLCYVLPTAYPVTMGASAWFLVLISLDRYR